MVVLDRPCQFVSQWSTLLLSLRSPCQCHHGLRTVTVTARAGRRTGGRWTACFASAPAGTSTACPWTPSRACSTAGRRTMPPRKCQREGSSKLQSYCSSISDLSVVCGVCVRVVSVLALAPRRALPISRSTPPGASYAQWPIKDHRTSSYVINIRKNTDVGHCASHYCSSSVGLLEAT